MEGDDGFGLGSLSTLGADVQKTGEREARGARSSESGDSRRCTSLGRDEWGGDEAEMSCFLDNWIRWRGRAVRIDS